MNERITPLISDEEKLESPVRNLSADEKYNRVVFQGYGVYFAFVTGEILTISDVINCSPRGGWFPDLYYMSDGELYYQWEGVWFNLYDKIADIGVPDAVSDTQDWIRLLENLDKNIVKAFYE